MAATTQQKTSHTLVENGGITAPTAGKNSTYAAVIGIDPTQSTHDQPLLQDPIPHGDDRLDIEALRQQYPMRNQIWAESDGETRDTGQSTYAQIPDAAPSAWTLHDGKFRSDFHPLKCDLLLPRIEVSLNDNTLVLDEHDYVPIPKGWGFSLLGFFAGRFPGKEAVNNLTLRWKKECRISFHPKGWIVFRFEKEEHAKQVLASGPYSVFGIPLVLCNMPSEFRFDSSPELQFNVWVTLPNLPLELWNPTAIAKIASVVGTPVEVDYQTITKQNVAGPRVLVLVDATNQPPESIKLQLHNGNTFEQTFSLDCFPFFCTRCRRAGHLATSCRASDFTNPVTRAGPRSYVGMETGNDGWTKVQNRKYRAGRSTSRRPVARSKSRNPTNQPPRSRSRPHKQQWVPVQKDKMEPSNPTNRNNSHMTEKMQNTHIRFTSPVSETTQGAIPISNRFESFDDLEQVEDVTEGNQTFGDDLELHNTCSKDIVQPTNIQQPDKAAGSIERTPVAAQMTNQPCQALMSVHDTDLTLNRELVQPCSFIYTQKAMRNHINVAESDLRAVLGLPQQTVAMTDIVDTSPLPVAFPSTANEPDLNPTSTGFGPLSDQQPAAVSNNPTTSECSTNDQNSIRLHQGSADTHSTEYVCAPTQTSFETPTCSSESVLMPENPNKEQPTSATDSLTNQVSQTYAAALSSPTNTLTAGKEQNLKKQRMEAKLDPRDAIKKKTKGTIPSSAAAHAGRVLINNNLTKKRK